MKHANIGRCRKYAGSATASILLYAIQVLHHAMEFEKDGVLWWTTTREQLMETTGLTRHEYDGAMARLRALGLVEVTHGPHATKPILRSTWLRMTDWALIFLGFAAQGSPLRDGTVLSEEQVEQILVKFAKSVTG